MNETVRVVKVGGSLFSFAEMPERVHAWCDRQPPATTVFIGGGGDLVQPLRTAHERFRLSEEVSHWLAVRAMTVTSRLLAKLLDVELVDRFEVVEQMAETGRVAACVLDVEEFLRLREPQLPGVRLPCDWTCTSDAIAARVAEVLSADDMVLMKAAAYPPFLTLSAAATQGLIDSHLPTAVAHLPLVRWINLMAPELEDVVVQRSQDWL